MAQLAQRMGANVEHVCFAARLGRLPQPVGRDVDGLLLYDVDVINPDTAKVNFPTGCTYREGARI